MAKSHLARTPLQIGDVNLVNARLFGEVNLTPAPLLSELPDSIANLDADIGVHPSSIDLVEALYLVDALSSAESDPERTAAPLPAMGAVWQSIPATLWQWKGIAPR